MKSPTTTTNTSNHNHQNKTEPSLAKHKESVPIKPSSPLSIQSSTGSTEPESDSSQAERKVNGFLSIPHTLVSSGHKEQQQQQQDTLNHHNNISKATFTNNKTLDGGTTTTQLSDIQEKLHQPQQPQQHDYYRKEPPMIVDLTPFQPPKTRMQHRGVLNDDDDKYDKKPRAAATVTTTRRNRRALPNDDDKSSRNNHSVRTLERVFWLMLMAATSTLSSLTCSSRVSVNNLYELLDSNMNGPPPMALAAALPVEQQDILPQDVSNATTAGDKQDNPFRLAMEQSYGFFSDMDTKEWEYRQEMARAEESSRGGRQNNQPPAFYIYSFHPFFSCPHLRRVGSRFLCDVHRIPDIVRDDMAPPLSVNRRVRSPGSRCLVYSFGHHDELSMEEGIQQIVGNTACDVHVFDPTPTRLQLSYYREHNFQNHEWGLVGSSSSAKKKKRGGNKVYKTLGKTMQELGHEGRVIDVLTINCNGCEWDMVPDLLGLGNRIVQLVVKTHNLADPPMATYDFFTKLYHNGYVLLHKDIKNDPGGSGQPRFKGAYWTFLKLDKAFLHPTTTTP